MSLLMPSECCYTFSLFYKGNNVFLSSLLISVHMLPVCDSLTASLQDQAGWCDWLALHVVQLLILSRPFI